MRNLIRSIAESDFKGADLSDALSGLSNVEANLSSSFSDGAPELAERIQAAILKVADKNPDQLKAAIALSKLDWRDLLVGADFAEDANAHKVWLNEQKPI